MTKAEVHLGLVGLGHWGRRVAATIGSMEDVRLALIASRNPESARLSGKTPVVGDWRELAHAGLDGVIVATPPASHGEILTVLVTAGVPVMVEKPLCLDVAEAHRLRSLVSRSGVPVLVDHTQLFHPAFPILKARAESYGPVRFIRSEGMGFGPFRSDVSVLWDWGPHEVSLCLALLGTVPTGVAAFGDGSSVAVRLEFGAQATAWLASSNLSLERRRILSVHFDGHALVLNDLAPHQLVEYAVPLIPSCLYPSLGPATALAVPKEMPLTRTIAHFVQGLRGGDMAWFGLDLASDVVRTLDAAQRSLGASSQPVTLLP